MLCLLSLQAISDFMQGCLLKEIINFQQNFPKQFTFCMKFKTFELLVFNLRIQKVLEIRNSLTVF